MVTSLIILIFAGVFSAFCWILEIEEGRKKGCIAIDKVKNNPLLAVFLLPQLIFAFSGFVLDIVITFLFTSMFVMSKSVYGMATAIMISNCFSVYIIVKMKKRKEEHD